ncbi:recombinase family protein [Catenuloplanes japonicus]|uniref:recombinase family protein n=1 Tax=Catenuloplanes japonicus TaxID=33876 RepID=UPI0006892079|nr:recombinase family protein [Catenuloplanes japonicus]
MIDRLQQQQTLHHPRRAGTIGRDPAPGNRFAFYGRISTSGFQDEESSRRWQLDSAGRVIDGAGVIVAEFFDVGYSRSLPWAERPQAATLLRAATAANREFDAIVVGEHERGFSGDQLLRMLPVLRRHGITVWLPEIGGPVDLDDPAHRALIRLLGHQSRTEVLRSRFRTKEAMRAQVRTQGRHHGGRAPYGYRLVDAGPHPNPVHAGWGRRLYRLDPDPRTAPHVRWMFAQRLAGRSAPEIAAALHQRRIPPPDGGRGARTSARRWSVRTVATILANPRYTGFQVWNRHSTDHCETLPGDKSTRVGGPRRRANAPADWVVSDRIAHPPLVSADDFMRAQKVSALPAPRDGSVRRYRLTGLVICGRCGRRAEGTWVHGRATYRCRHGQGARRTLRGPRPLYVREDALLAYARGQIGTQILDDVDKAFDEISGRLRNQGMTLICDGDSIVLHDPTPPEDDVLPTRSRTPVRTLPVHALTWENSPPGRPTDTRHKRRKKSRNKCRCKPLKLRLKSRSYPRRG